jgi:glycerol-3-phosphate dehydrogenase (NAD(P)+)
MKKISILGIGRWGSLLAWYLRNQGFEVLLWGRNSEKLMLLKNTLRNQYVRLQPDIMFSDDIQKALSFSDTFIVSILSQGFKGLCNFMKGQADFKRRSMISTMKGIDSESLKRMSEIAEEELNIGNFVVLGGPGHAEEIAAGRRTCLVVASPDDELNKQVSRVFYSRKIRIYTLNDTVGVELSGAYKNVIGIASGICDGIGEFDLKASLISRSIVEIKKLGKRLGANPETFNGLSLVGDYCVTCFGSYSKNRQVGERIAKGEKLSSINISAEGIPSTLSFYELSKKYNIEMPICEQVYNILFRGYTVKKALDILWDRPLIREFL